MPATNEVKVGALSIVNSSIEKARKKKESRMCGCQLDSQRKEQKFNTWNNLMTKTRKPIKSMWTVLVEQHVWYGTEVQLLFVRIINTAKNHHVFLHIHGP